MNLEKITETEYPDLQEYVSMEPTHRAARTILFDAYEMFQEDTNENFFSPSVHNANIPEKEHELARGMFLLLAEKYSSEDITAFSVELGEYQSKFEIFNAGIFISAMINVHFKKTQSQKEYRIITSHLEKAIDNIGILNCGAKIRVDGDVGRNLGAKMKSGTITVEGNAGVLVGSSMHGGTISVRNAGNCLGLSLHGGAIHVSGSSGKFIGENMQYGTIFLDGTYERSNISKDFRNGEIIFQGKRISLYDLTEDGL